MSNYKDRMVKANPVWGDFVKSQNPMGNVLVDGAVAGDVAVTDIKSGDQIISVIDMTNLVDLTSEFSIVKDGVINNTGGTSTAAAKVQVTYWRWEVR